MLVIHIAVIRDRSSDLYVGMDVVEMFLQVGEKGHHNNAKSQPNGYLLKALTFLSTNMSSDFSSETEKAIFFF